MTLQPISLKEAKEFIIRHHRHHLPPVGYKFCIGVNDGKSVVGVLIAGRPVARHFDDGWTIEVTRCCTNGYKNAPSMLYGAAARVARGMGYRRIITYTLPSESGSSLNGAGWNFVWKTSGGSWDSKTRPRVDKAPTCQKLLWEKSLK